MVENHQQRAGVEQIVLFFFRFERADVFKVHHVEPRAGAIEHPQLLAFHVIARLDLVLQLVGLLDDFLKFARVRKLDLVPGSLNRIVERVLDFFEPQAQQLGIDFIRYLDPDLPGILLDSQFLYLAVLNLVKNAIEAMPSGGQLVARTRPVRNGVSLDLIDTGIGMNEETASHMFEAFYSTKQEGSGLGLPTTRRILDAHNSQIDVQTEVGRGTQFTLTFPVPVRIGT